MSSYRNEYHGDGVTIAKGVAGNLAGMAMGAGFNNYWAPATARAAINVGVGIAEAANMNSNFREEFGEELEALARELNASEQGGGL